MRKKEREREREREKQREGEREREREREPFTGHSQSAGWAQKVQTTNQANMITISASSFRG